MSLLPFLQSPRQSATTRGEHPIELLPWLVNGSLAVDAREEVVLHLRSCPACRRELTATAEAHRLLTRHVESVDLVDYVLGAVDDGPRQDGATRERIRRHLAGCATCRDEARLVAAGVPELAGEAAVDEVPPAVPGRLLRLRDRGPRQPWLRLALAAAFVGAVASFFVLQQVGGDRPTSPPSAETTIAVKLDPVPASAGPTAATGDVVVLFSDGFESGDLGRWGVEEEATEP